MKMLKKLALASAVSMISAGAFAMEAMDDESMSATTGQDGITINVVLADMSRLSATGYAAGTGVLAGNGVSTAGFDGLDVSSPTNAGTPNALVKGLTIDQIIIHDDDGLSRDYNQDGLYGGANATSSSTVSYLNYADQIVRPTELAGAGLNNSGAIVIGDGTALDRTVVLADDTAALTIDIDTVGSTLASGGTGGAMLSVAITTPRLLIKTGNIYVGNSDAAAAGYDANGGVVVSGPEIDGTTATGLVKILDGLELVMGASTTKIQLGNESAAAAGGFLATHHMINVDSALVGGLAINNFALYDQNGATADAFGTTVATGAGGAIRMKSMIMTDTGNSSQLTMKVGVDVGAIQSGTAAAPNAAYTAAATYQTTKTQDFEANAASAGAFTTRAALLDSANGVDNILGNADDVAASVAFLTTADADVTAETTGAGASVVHRTLTGIKANTFNGLILTLQQVGGSSGMDIAMNNLSLGGDRNPLVAGTQNADLGDIQIKGLNLNGTQVVIYGH